MNEPVDAGLPQVPTRTGKVELNDAPERYGGFAAAGLLRLTASPVPAEFEGKPVRRDERRFASPEALLDTWKDAEDIVFASEKNDVRSEILGEGEAQLRMNITRAKEEAAALIARSEPQEGEALSDYFVPYNADPKTLEVFSPGQGEEASVNYVDERGNIGVATNPTLAKIAALSNFYGRLSRNPAAQRAFLKGIVDAGKTEDGRAENLVLARAVAAFGAVYMAKYPMMVKDPRAHIEFYLAQNNLGSLAENLASLERT